MRPIRNLLKNVYYNIPERYEKALFNANANLFEMVNFNAAKAHSIIYPDLVESIQNINPKLDTERTETVVLNFIRNLEPCDVFTEYHFPVQRKIGICELVTSIRAYHGCFLNSTTLGGLRLQKELNEYSIRGLAVLATYRNACFNLDVSGAYGGIELSKDLYDPEDLKLALNLYTDNLRYNRGSVDIVQTSAISLNEDKLYASGKDFSDAGAKTAVTVLKKIMDIEHFNDKTFIVQGLGSNGFKIGQDLCRLGAKCVGFLDKNCSYYEPTGILLKELSRHMKQYGTLLNFRPKVKENDGDKIFGEECDILVLADKENVLNFSNAERVKTKVVLEASIGPVTPIADKILNSKDIIVVPSILSGSGKTLMAYFDYLEKIGKVKSSEEMIMSNIEETVIGTLKIKHDLGLDLRTAAYVKAIRKLFNTMVDKEVKMSQIAVHQKE